MQLESKKLLFDRLLTNDRPTAGRIGEHARIIAFRNILAHGYADIDDRIVRGIVESNLPRLLEEVGVLLK